MRASKDNPTFGESGNRIKTLSVALMEPEFPLNVGYVARAMANFGMRQLLIVSRKKMARREEDEAAKFASHASQIINNMHYVKSVSDLRKRFHIIVGTTAIRGRRKSNITRKTMNVEECAKIVSAIASGSQKICILFGRDTTGLTNLELQQCEYTLTIATGTEYGTLNISHAAAIIFYVFSRFCSNKKGAKSLPQVRDSSTRPERERVIRLFEELAILSDFQKFKQGKLKETLTRLLDRSNPSLRELYLLMGLGSKARTKIRTLEAKRRNTR